jgi:hypothetical protein
LPGLVLPTTARAARLLAGALAAPIALLGASAWLLGSDMPRGPPPSRRAHEAPGIDVFRIRL